MKLRTVVYVLRLAIFMTFLGHGIFAIKSNPNWFVYLETVGFSVENAKNVIVVIGIVDVLVALIVLLRPNKYVVLWAVIWGFATALIRPLSGESIWSFIERGSNWGAPLALFLLLYVKSKK